MSAQDRLAMFVAFAIAGFGLYVGARLGGLALAAILKYFQQHGGFWGGLFHLLVLPYKYLYDFLAWSIKRLFGLLYRGIKNSPRKASPKLDIQQSSQSTQGQNPPSETTTSDSSTDSRIASYSPYGAGINKWKGDLLEEYVMGLFADTARVCRVIEDNRGRMVKNMIAENAKRPDFLIEQQVSGKRVKYWVECKYRSHFDHIGHTDGSDVEVFRVDGNQLNRYREIARKSGDHKVFIAFGLGGIDPLKPNKRTPTYLYIVPINYLGHQDNLGNRYITRDELNRYWLIKDETASAPDDILKIMKIRLGYEKPPVRGESGDIDLTKPSIGLA